jgi:hypothetical protein
LGFFQGTLCIFFLVIFEPFIALFVLRLVVTNVGTSQLPEKFSKSVFQVVVAKVVSRDVQDANSTHDQFFVSLSQIFLLIDEFFDFDFITHNYMLFVNDSLNVISVTWIFTLSQVGVWCHRQLTVSFARPICHSGHPYALDQAKARKVLSQSAFCHVNSEA